MKLKRIVVSAVSAVALAIGLGSAASAPAQASTNYKSTYCYAGQAKMSLSSWVNSDGSKTYHIGMTSPWVSRTGPDQYYRPSHIYIGGLRITGNLGDGYMTWNGSGAQVNRSSKAYWNLWTNGMEYLGPDLKSCSGLAAI